MHLQSSSKQVSPILAALHAHVDAHRTADQDWPADAVFAIRYRCSTWPCGWQTYYSVEFCKTFDEVYAWVARYRHWARLEDNYFEYSVYEWDLGPNLIPEHIVEERLFALKPKSAQ